MVVMNVKRCHAIRSPIQVEQVIGSRRQIFIDSDTPMIIADSLTEVD